MYLENSCSLTSIFNSKTVDCRNTSSCTVDIETSEIANNCLYNKSVNKYFYVAYQCASSFVESGKMSFTRDTLSIIIACIDAGSMLILLITLILIKRDQSRVSKHFYENYVNIANFTIQIKNIDIKNNDKYKILNDLISHLEICLKKDITNNEIEYEEGNKKINSESVIYEINFPNINPKKLNFILKKEKLIKLHQETVLAYEHYKRTLEYKNISKTEANLKKLKEEIVVINQKMQADKKEDIELIEDLFITFTDIKRAQYVTKLYNHSKCTRFWYIFCCQYNKIKHLYFKNKWLNIKYIPDAPSNVRWENMNYNKFKGLLLKFTSFIVTIIIIVIGIIIISYGKFFQNELNEQFDNNVNCNLISFDEDSVFKEYTDLSINMRAKIKTFCYCEQKFFTGSYLQTDKAEIIVGDITIYPCSNWISAFFKYTAMTYAIIITIPIINCILLFVIRRLTFLEHNRTIMNDKLSNMVKVAIAQFINTSISILIINIRVQEIATKMPYFPVFAGLYADFDSSWFKNVGSTVVFAVLVGSFVPHFVSYAFACIVSFRKCLDSGNLLGLNSKIFVKSKFNSIYVGPEFELDLEYAGVLFIFNYSYLDDIKFLYSLIV